MDTEKIFLSIKGEDGWTLSVVTREFWENHVSPWVNVAQRYSQGGVTYALNPHLSVMIPNLV